MESNLVLKKFFTKSLIDNLIAEENSDFINYVIKRYTIDPETKNYEELISEVYCTLKNSYRTEYYYKNTLLNKLLFKQHNYKSTSVLTELPISKSKADFVMINGKGVVYEIKTELDNLDRLDRQIGDYYKAFDYVYVVTYDENISKIVEQVPLSVGIMCLTKRGALKTIRKAERCNDNFDITTIFNLLRKKEFEQILLDCGYKLPVVSQFIYYKKCLEIMQKMDVLMLQKQMLRQLKSRTKSNLRR